jgi:hypothetical protein
MANDSSTDNTYMNIITFIILTIVYFAFAKPKLTISILTNADEYAAYAKRSYFMLALYLMIVLLVQFSLNTSSVVSKCGGNLSSNMGYAALITFGPWLAIFGILIVVLISFPGMKSAFSDVIGYYAVSNSANKLLADLLVDTDVNDKIKAAGDNTDDTKKQAMQDAAEAVMKMVGNVSIMINQIVPSNFLQYWQMLLPLMKDKYQSSPDSVETTTKEQALLDLVVMRDNIGEACWYIYTSILLISIIQYRIATKKCENDPKLMNANYDNYLEEQKQAEAVKKIANSTTYKLN